MVVLATSLALGVDCLGLFAVVDWPGGRGGLRPDGGGLSGGAGGTFGILLLDTTPQEPPDCTRSRRLGRMGNCCPPPPPCDMTSGCCFLTGPWTVTRSPLRMLRRVAAFCRLLRSVLLLVSLPRLRSPVVGVPGLCWMWQDVPFAR